MSDLQKLHRDVWTFRGAVADYWATPPPLDALRYAVTECGEALDVFLRLKRQGDSRNNSYRVTEGDLLDELADAALMLLTAVNLDVIPRQIQVDNYFVGALMPEQHRIDLLCVRVAQAAFAARQDDDETSQVYFQWIYSAIEAARWIETYPGMDLERRMHGRLARIFERHVAPFLSSVIADELRAAAMPWEAVA